MFSACLFGCLITTQSCRINICIMNNNPTIIIMLSISLIQTTTTQTDHSTPTDYCSAAKLCCKWGGRSFARHTPYLPWSERSIMLCMVMMLNTPFSISLFRQIADNESRVLHYLLPTMTDSHITYRLRSGFMCEQLDFQTHLSIMH